MRTAGATSPKPGSTPTGAEPPATPSRLRQLTQLAGSVGLRGITMPGKLAFILVLARYLSPQDVGVYGLMASSVWLALQLVGLDFHAFTTREMVAEGHQAWARQMRDAGSLYLLAYVTVIPVAAVLFSVGVLSWQLAPWFAMLVVVEHASQEVYRFLVAQGRPLAANLLFFIRAGAWVYLLAPAMLISPGARSLTVVWTAWLGGNLASLAVGVWMLRSLVWRNLPPIDWVWIRKGVRVALPFLVASLSLRGINAIDRYVLGHFCGRADVGVFTFYAQLATGILLLAEAGVLVVFTPKAVRAARTNAWAQLRTELRRLALALGMLLLATIPVAALLISTLLQWLERPLYGESLPVFWVLLASAAVQVAALVPHCALYARGIDRALVAAAVAGLLTALVVDLSLIPTWGPLGAAFASLAASVVIGATKTVALLGSGERRG